MKLCRLEIFSKTFFPKKIFCEMKYFPEFCIEILNEKSKNRKISKIEFFENENFKKTKFSKNFEVSTLGARRSGPDKRIFSIFLKLCRIFVRERTRRLEVTQTRLEQHNPQNSFCWTALTTH